jgi:hypothetical protein
VDTVDRLDLGREAYAVCWWQAEAVEPVQEYVDAVSGDASENTFFEVSREHAVGLPETAARAS